MNSRLWADPNKQQADNSRLGIPADADDGNSRRVSLRSQSLALLFAD